MDIRSHIHIHINQGRLQREATNTTDMAFESSQVA